MGIRTVGQLIKELEKYPKRTRISVEWKSFESPDFSHYGIHHVDTDWINVCDGDGFTINNKDGTERQRLNVVLRGRPVE